MTNPTAAPKFETREQWLMAAYAILRPRFDELAELVNTAMIEAGKTLPGIATYTMPETVHISTGFGYGAKRENGVILGQTWIRERSADKVNHMFISPEIAHASTVLGVMIHEMLHVLFDGDHGHDRVFAAFGQMLGLKGKPTEMLPGPAFEMELMLMAERELGAYPHSALDVARTAAIVPAGAPVPVGGFTERGYIGPAPQSARMIKAWCPGSVPEGQPKGCGYTMRVARSWIVVARPVCPNPVCARHLHDMVTSIDADPING
jgi:hypothetical protein